ncbi:MAG: hypothetical protein ACTTH7_04350 [Treponema sp.]
MVQYTLLDESEKDIVARICRKFVALSQQSRRTGILSLEEELELVTAEFDGKNGKYAQKLLRFIIDGHEQNIIRDIADNYIASSCKNDFEVLCFTLIKIGICAIQDGMYPPMLAEIFMSYIGFDGEKDFRQRTSFVEE